ncbi:MAG: hydroxyethylthiazole kinase [Pseudolabrys sp.]|nr:hydroxyethylthiazole kinase [Pseudolabrys sp.]MDP2294645.1 hydroxyethylthiazole kinase [Pseudolabrys sp.]
MQHPIKAARADIPREELASQAAAVLARLRAKSPRVHCITNSVAQNFTANALLALGAVPSMTLSPEEIGAFVARSDALLVNLGTFDRERREATAIAVDAATQSGRPWVLDPVFVDRAPGRAAYARDLVVLAPKAIRLNAAEFTALAESEPSRDAVAAYAQMRRTVIGLSGATDLIADGERIATIANGHALMARVTAMGCAASSIVAACLAVEPDALRATSSAMLIVGVAGEMAAKNAKGPGSFAAAILDALYNIDAHTLADKARAE